MVLFLRLGAFVALVGLMTPGVDAAQTYRLSTVATVDGYSFQWLPTENGAMLGRPGLRVIIRAGSVMYEVNDATPEADRAPSYDGRDILISRKMAEHLRVLAIKYPSAALTLPRPLVSNTDDAVPAMASAHAITLVVKQVPGHEAVNVTGTAAPNTVVRIVLAAELSQDLPIVTLMAKNVTSDAHGEFSTDLGYGQNPHPHTFLTVTAASADGEASAPSRFEVGYPSPHLSTPGLDVFPKK